MLLLSNKFNKKFLFAPLALWPSSWPFRYISGTVGMAGLEDFENSFIFFLCLQDPEMLDIKKIFALLACGLYFKLLVTYGALLECYGL